MPMQFELRIVPAEMYPDLKVNPTNPYTNMTDEERLEDFIETLAVFCAETCSDKVRGKDDLKDLKAA